VQTDGARWRYRLVTGLEYVAAPVAVVAVWQVMISIDGALSTVLPSPGDVARDLYVTLVGGQLPSAALLSVLRLLGGVGVGFVVGVCLGVMMYLVGPVRWALDWVINGLRSVPGVAWAPLSVLVFGIGGMASAAVIAVAVCFIAAVYSLDGLQQVPVAYRRAAAVAGYGERSLGMLLRVLIPAAGVRIAAGARVSFSVGWMTIVAAEMVGAASGLGYMIEFYRRFLFLGHVLASMVWIGILAVLIDFVIGGLEQLLIPYASHMG